MSTAYDSDLTVAQWELLEPLISAAKRPKGSEAASKYHVTARS